MSSTTTTRVGTTLDQTSPLQIHSLPLTTRPWQLLHLVRSGLGLNNFVFGTDRIYTSLVFLSFFTLIIFASTYLMNFLFVFFNPSCTRHNFCLSLWGSSCVPPNLCHPTGRSVQSFSPCCSIYNDIYFHPPTSTHHVFPRFHILLT